MKKTLKFLSSVLLISTLGLVNCHKYETGGSAANGYLIGSYINNLIQTGTYGNCAISVNGSGLWFGKVVETAITDGASYTTATPNIFDKVDYQAVTGTTLTDTEWTQLPYNKRYTAFFSTSADGSTWTIAKRNAALSFTRGKMNAVAGLGMVSAACDAAKGTATFTALGSSAAPFGTVVSNWYASLNTVEQAEVDNFYNVSLNFSLKNSLLTSTYTNPTFRVSFPNIATSATTGLPTGISTAYTGTTLTLATASANLAAILADLSKAGGIWSSGVPSAKAACSTILSENATTINSSPYTTNADISARVLAVNSLFTGANQNTAAHITTLNTILTFGGNAALAGLNTTLAFNGTCTGAGAVLTSVQCLAASGTTSTSIDAILTAMGAATTAGIRAVGNGTALASCITLDRLDKLVTTTLTKDMLIGAMPTFPSDNSDSPSTIPTTGTSAGVITVLDPSGGYTNISRVAAYNALSNTVKAQYALHGIITAGGTGVSFGPNFYTLGATNLRCPATDFAVQSQSASFPLNIAPAGSNADPAATGAVLTGANGGTVNAACSFAAGGRLNCSPATFIGATVTCSEALNGAGTACATAGFTTTTVTGIFTNGTVTVASAPTGNSAGLVITFGGRATGIITNNQVNVNASYTHASIYKILTGFNNNSVPSGFAPSYVISRSTIPTSTGTSTATSLVALRSLVGSGALACARIPRANCTYATTTTGSRQTDLNSIGSKYHLLNANSSCAQPDSTTLTALGNAMNYEGNVLAPTSSVSALTGNKLLPEKAYPKFGSLVDLGFGMVMPVKEGTTRYPDYTTSATVNASFEVSSTDFGTEGYFTSMGTTGGSNIGYSVVESCENIGLGSGPFPNAPSGVKKPLTPVAELIYALGNNGGAAADYANLRNISYTASGTVSGYWRATTTQATGAITAITFSDTTLSAQAANGVSIVSAPTQGFGFPSSTYSAGSSISIDPTQTSVTVDTVNFETTGTFTGALKVGTTIPSIRVSSTSFLIGVVANTAVGNTNTFGLPASFVNATLPTNVTLTLTVTSSQNGTAFGTFTGNFQNLPFTSPGYYTGTTALAFTAPSEAQARACNSSLRAATSTEITSSSTLKHLVPAGYKLPDTGATSGNGGITSTLALCTYGQAVAGNDLPNAAFASILTSALGGNSTNAVTTCSATARAAAVQFGEMVAK